VTNPADTHLRKQALKLFETGKTVSEVCRLLGRSRTWFYKWRNNFRLEGSEGLRNRKRRSNPHNKTPVKIEEIVLATIDQFPAYGPQRIAYILKRNGTVVGKTAVHGVMKRNGLNRRKERLEWVRIRSGEIITLSELETARQKAKSRHIEAQEPGELVGLDTFYVGCLKGVGRIYQMTGCDTATSFGWAKLYTDKSAFAAIDFVEHVIASSHGVPVKAVLTDNGKEFTTHWDGRCHDFEFFLKMNRIGHHYTQVRHPWTNGFTERLNRTILEEFLQIALRKTRYHSLEQLQCDLDRFMNDYNFYRPHQGYRLKGSTPADHFITIKRAA
jgi:transposase InsO family protein